MSTECDCETIAVVVTYKRPKMLSENLEALGGIENIHVLVINNGGQGDQETNDIIRQFEKSHFCGFKAVNTAVNLGGAGGFALGLKLVQTEHLKYVWIMDDDCIPNRSAFQELLAVANLQPIDNSGKDFSFFASSVRWIDGQAHQMNIPKLAKRWAASGSAGSNNLVLESASFVSLLVPVKNVRRVGLPISEFYIWSDDVEYTKRLCSIIGNGLLVTNSNVLHKTPFNLGTNFKLINKNEIWKYRRGLANSIATDIGYGNYFTALRRFSLFIYRIVSGKSSFTTKIQVLSSAFRIPYLILLVRKARRGLIQ